jgi:hypothetical protein
MQQIFSNTCHSKPQMLLQKKKEKKDELRKDVESIVDTIDFKEVQQQIMTKDEYRAINNKLSLKKAEKFISESKHIYMGKLAKLSELDFQGRDALPFFEKGGQILI